MRIAIVHYSVAPVVGGVEAVIQAHAGLLLNAGYHVRLVAGAGSQDSLSQGVEFVDIPQLNTLNPRVVEVSQALEHGDFTEDFEPLSLSIQEALVEALAATDIVIIHNIFTKHFNLPLTAALMKLIDQGHIQHGIAWCHDFSWTSPHSRSMVHPGYPWDLLRTYREDVIYVTVSRTRQEELAGLFKCPPDLIHVVYNGVDPIDIFSLSIESQQLIERLDLAKADLILLMPVRITQAKNIELALRVVARLKANGMQIKLVVTGPPDPHDPGDMQYYQSLLELRRQLGIEHEARFVYELGPQPGQGYTIDFQLLRELVRVCDVLFMPSHREGFGMPIIEAGLVGMPIFTTAIPAAQEIGRGEVMRFSHDDPAEKVADMILSWANSSPTQVLRRRIRNELTWQAIFQHDMLPLLSRKGAE